jgi:hypothetical protein
MLHYVFDYVLEEKRKDAVVIDEDKFVEVVTNEILNDIERGE